MWAKVCALVKRWAWGGYQVRAGDAYGLRLEWLMRVWRCRSPPTGRAVQEDFFTFTGCR